MLKYLLILTLAMVVTPVGAADDVKVAMPDFVISYWFGPPPKFTTLDRYQEIKDANFTLAFPAGGGMTVEQNRKMLDHCQSVGMKAVIMDSRMVYSIDNDPKKKAALDAIIKDYSDHPALFGYYVVDEPGAGAFKGLGDVVAYLKEKDPKHPGYINLLPTYGRDFNVLGTKTYEEYVRKYAEIVKPFAICYDHYHFTNHGDRSDFFENLETVRKVSVESNIPFWNIVLAVQHGDYRNLNEHELRFEAMQTLAYGAKGLLWFTYWSPAEADKSTEWKHPMINADGSKDPHYDMIKTINAEVLAFGEALKTAKSTDVRANRKAGPRFTVGEFKTPDGHELRFIANDDYKNALSLPVAIPVAKAERFDPATRKWNPIEVQADGGKTRITVDLSPGGGALVRWR
jgi:hypothetical protein